MIIKKNIRKTGIFCKSIIRGFTLAKFLSGLFTIILVALIRYCVAGNISIDYSDLGGNVVIGLIGWTLNTGLIGMLTEYLDIKGININLHEFIFGLDTMKVDGPSTSEIMKPRHKLYNAMESNDGSDNTPSDKGKGIDRQVHPFYTGGQGTDRALDSDNQSLDKDKQVDPTWGLFLKKTNPGPGFNVPGGEVPIQDDICKHIGYNSHILTQFKTMDLETAITQRDNNLTLIRVMEQKEGYAQEAFAKMPVFPRTEAELKQKDEIIKDLNEINTAKTRAEARATLLNSRIQFIEIKLNANTKSQ